MSLKIFEDRKFRLPRLWSNAELKKFAHLFTGDIVNVSAWQDSDKNGKRYKDYFVNCKSYSITNYKSEARGFQGTENEIFLDLTAELDENLKKKFDVVFNHTCLEHIFAVDTAFKNLCEMSSDIVITVVPFLQQMHADYGDFWRFTPTCIQKLFEKNHMTVLYSTFNSNVDASVYIFTIASHKPEKWAGLIQSNLEQNIVKFNEKIWLADSYEPMVGSNSIPNIFGHLGYWFARLKRKI